MNLTTTEFKGLAMEVQSEYLYFLTSWEELTHEIIGLEAGVKRKAVYVTPVTEEMSAMDRLNARKAWVEKELEGWEKYQEYKEDLERYEKRLNRIVSSVRESK